MTDHTCRGGAACFPCATHKGVSVTVLSVVVSASECASQRCMAAVGSSAFALAALTPARNSGSQYMHDNELAGENLSSRLQAPRVAFGSLSFLPGLAAESGKSAAGSEVVRGARL